MPAPPRLFDRTLHRRRLERAAPRFGAADFLKARAAVDAVERLEAILRSFPVAVDLGARNGAFAQALAASDARERVGLLIEADLAQDMLAGRPGPRVQADEERLPFADASLDLVVSTLALHWVNDLPGALIQVRRALRPDGLFLGAMLGGATLTELRQCLTAAEAELTGGAGLRVSPFADAYDAAGLLQRAGFALPVADVDRVTVRYAHPLKLIEDLRAMGETNALVDRARQPLSRAVLARTCALYAERFSEPDGRVRATFDILTMTGWAPHPDQQQPLKPGSAKMRLADALRPPGSEGATDAARLPPERAADGAGDVLHDVGGLVAEGGHRRHHHEEHQRADHGVFDRRGPPLVADESLQRQSRSQATNGASAGGIG